MQGNFDGDVIMMVNAVWVFYIKAKRRRPTSGPRMYTSKCADV